ncbi:MAG: hypothetical protein PHW28_06795 [Mesotoga sp.]|nr:hypothetical protein [Mesotoga sp.]
MSKVLLTDEELRQIIINGKIGDSIAVLVSQAQYKKIVDWLEKPCPHIPPSFPNPYQPRRTCPECWQEFNHLHNE